MELTKEFRERFVKRLQGKDFILYGGLLELAKQKGIKRLEVEIVQLPSEDNGHYAACMATLESEDGQVYSEVGDATPESVNRNIAPHLLRMAATRAKARALRDFVGIDMTALEELGEIEVSEEPARPNRRGETTHQQGNEVSGANRSDNGEAPILCTECGARITQAISRFSTRRLGRPLCLACQAQAIAENRNIRGR